MLIKNKEKNEQINSLVSALKNNETGAFDELYSAYSEKVFSYTRKILKNNEDAEDAVMDTFLSVSQNIGDLRSEASFDSWLFRIAKYSAFRIIKHNKENEAVHMETQALFDHVVSKNSDEMIMVPEDYSSNIENKRALAGIINSLSEVQRQAIYLHYYKNYPIKQIAEQTGVSENTVKTRLLLAKKYIKSKVEAMREQGAMLAAAPISVIFEELGDLVVVNPSVVTAVSAGGMTAGISIAAIASTAVIIGVSVMSGFHNERLNVDNTKGDKKTSDSISESLSDSQYPIFDLSNSELAVEDDGSMIISADTYSPLRPTQSRASDDTQQYPNTNGGDRVTDTTDYRPDNSPSQPSNEPSDSKPDTASSSVSSSKADNSNEPKNISINDIGYEYTDFWVNTKPNALEVSGDYSYVKVTDFSLVNNNTLRVRYEIYSDSYTVDTLQPVLTKTCGCTSDYYREISPDKVYVSGGECVAEFNNVLSCFYSEQCNAAVTFPSFSHFSYADENGLYEKADNGDLCAAQLCISDNGSFTIGKNLKYLEGYKDFVEGDYSYSDPVLPIRESQVLFTSYPQINRIFIDEENPYFFFENDILYSSYPNGVKMMLWCGGLIHGDYFRLSDNITMFDQTVLDSICTETLDIGNNIDIISALIKHMNSSVNNLIITPDDNGSDIVDIHIPENNKLNSITINSGGSPIELSIDYCKYLKYITIAKEADLTSAYFISDNQYDLGTVFRVYEGSPAHKTVVREGLPFELIKE